MTTTERGRIVLFTGPSAAGKSTVGETWAASRTVPTAFFDQDQARFLVRSGYVSRSAALANPDLRDQADTQWLLAAAVCEAMAETYRAWGFDFAVAAFRPPGAWRGAWERLDAMHPTIIVLLAAPDILTERDAARTGRTKVGAAGVQRNLQYDWNAWRTDPRATVIDNSTLTVDEVVAQVEDIVQRR